MYHFFLRVPKHQHAFFLMCRVSSVWRGLNRVLTHFMDVITEAPKLMIGPEYTVSWQCHMPRHVR